MYHSCSQRVLDFMTTTSSRLKLTNVCNPTTNFPISCIAADSKSKFDLIFFSTRKNYIHYLYVCFYVVFI